MYRPESFSNICPVFPVDDVRKTTQFYVEKLGFTYAHHFDKIANFATVYRDAIEIVLVQKGKGEVVPNQARYGNGYDAYIDTQELEGVDIIYEEYRKNGVKIISAPQMTDYGSYEFVFEDIDGRRIGIGLIAKKEVYFAESNYLDGPYAALLIKGDEKARALASIYEKLAQAWIRVGEAYGIAEINAEYGVLLYLNQEDCSKALAVLEM